MYFIFLSTFMYIALLAAAIITAVLFCCIFCVRKICPDEPILFDALELEDIRIERAEQAEERLMSRIDTLKA
jgi:hypothetical protein